MLRARSVRAGGAIWIGLRRRTPPFHRPARACLSRAPPCLNPLEDEGRIVDAVVVDAAQAADERLGDGIEVAEGQVAAIELSVQDHAAEIASARPAIPAGLNDRAVQAVRQWRFAPARRLGTPVDVVVEVAVEFKLR